MTLLGSVRYGLLDRALERGLLPDPLLRSGSRWGARLRPRRRGPIAESVGRANEQHYELPVEFFELFLGPRLKYSSGWWGPGVGDLAAAEEAMLALSCERAGIEDGMSVLDLDR